MALDQVGLLLRVALEVVDLFIALEAAVFHAVVQTSPASQTVQWTPEAERSFLESRTRTPVGQTPKILTHHPDGVDARQSGEGRCDIKEAGRGIKSPRFNVGAAQDHGDAEQFIVQRMAVLKSAVLPEFLPVV